MAAIQLMMALNPVNAAAPGEFVSEVFEENAVAENEFNTTL